MWGRLDHLDLRVPIWDVKRSNHSRFTILYKVLCAPTPKNLSSGRTLVGVVFTLVKTVFNPVWKWPFDDLKSLRTVTHSHVFVNQLNLDPCCPGLLYMWIWCIVPSHPQTVCSTWSWPFWNFRLVIASAMFNLTWKWPFDTMKLLRTILHSNVYINQLNLDPLSRSLVAHDLMS